MEDPSSIRESDSRTNRPRSHDRAVVAILCAMLMLVIGLIYGQTADFEFLNYDDDAFVYQNRLVRGELTPQSLAAVFTENSVLSTMPLTYISHMLVWHLLGHDASFHHVTNVVLHAAAAVVLLLVLWRMTNSVWPSALAAAVFAVHPLRVESVAWVTELKDVLSGLLFALTLAAYSAYAKRPASLWRYLVVVVCFVLGLAAKPVAVTLPFLLLLLDYWPLGRMSKTTPGEPARCSIPIKLVLEKIPLLLVTVAFCLLSVLGRSAAALSANQKYSLGWRIGNAAISYAQYLGQFVFPVNLIPAYPRRSVLPPWQMAGAAILLLAITALALWWRKQRPYLLVGWLWYLGMMVPTIGLVQFGVQAEADRFTYLPQIGLAIALAWGIAEACHRWPRSYMTLAALASCVVMVLALAAWRQTSRWRDNETLWKYTLACVPRNAVARNQYGSHLAQTGRIDEAVAQLRKSLEADPSFAPAHTNLGRILASRGKIDEAESHLRESVAADPSSVAAHNNLGCVLANRGQTDEALAHFRESLKIDPLCAEAYAGLGNALAKIGKTDEAAVNFQKALRLKPYLAAAHSGLGSALSAMGRTEDAERHMKEALAIDDECAEVHNNFGAMLMRDGRVDEAAAEFRRAAQLAPASADFHCNLGLALRSLDQLDGAAAEFRKAIELNPDFGEAHGNLGGILFVQDKLDEALVHFQKHVELDPASDMARQNFALAVSRLRGPPAALAHWRWWIDYLPNDGDLLNDAAWQLATSSNDSLRNGKDAVQLALKAMESKGNRDPALLRTLAAAYAETGRFDEAVKTARRAAIFAGRQKNAELEASIRNMLVPLQAGKPYRETAEKD